MGIYRGRQGRVGAKRILRFSLDLGLPLLAWKTRKIDDFFLQANTDPTSSTNPYITPDINKGLFLLHFRSPVRLAYDNFDANAAGKDLPPLMILHGLFGSKRNLRDGEDVQ